MITDRVEAIIKDSIEEKNLQIVRIRLMGGEHRKTLQIMIERKGGESATIKDCQKVSKIASTLFMVDEPIKDEFNLEISSAGIDRPLVKIDDFERFIGERVKVKTKFRVGNTTRFRGVINSTEGNNIFIIEENNNKIELNIADIMDANLDKERFLFSKQS